MQPLFECWRAAVRFKLLDRIFRKRIRANKQAQVDSLIQHAHEAEARGISQLQTLSKQIRPKAPKRSIHFRSADGHLLSPREELQRLQDFFSDLYQSVELQRRTHRLQQPLAITQQEIRAALQHMSARKALPPGHMPSRLWKVASDDLIPQLHQSFNTVLQQGPIHFPETWHRAFLALLPKAGKPPIRPANLRPISLLSVESKLLARIAAERIKPYVQRALQHIPQFAYSYQRQTADCIDRALAHCHHTREQLKLHQRTVFTTFARRQHKPLVGGMVLSLDLSRAFDMLARSCLERSLKLVGIPDDLVTLVLFIHDNAVLVLEKHSQQVELGMSRGIRQGCGLSPLLWLCFTVLVREILSQYLPKDSMTGFADDYLVKWDFNHSRDFLNATRQVSRLLQDFESLGMQVSTDKTVILLAMKGNSGTRAL